MSKIEPEAWKQRTGNDHREWGGGEQRKEGEVSRQGTCMDDPWTWTRLWELTEGAGGRHGRGEQQVKNSDDCIRTTVKLKFFSQSKKKKNFLSP